MSEVVDQKEWALRLLADVESSAAQAGSELQASRAYEALAAIERARVNINAVGVLVRMLP